MQPTREMPKTQSPSVLGKYRILSELGRGGMGVVYLAEDTRLKRQVALKSLHPALSLDQGFVERFALEAQAIATLTHPGIVRVHSFEDVDGRHLIDMEYIAGGSLEALVAAGPCDRKDALTIVARILEALSACHERGLVHRDIKPSNVLLAPNGHVYLSDFGLAISYAVAASATSSCFLGTPKYAPPESWDSATPSPAGDVYSTGMVLLELLAGSTPYDGDAPMEIMRKMITTPHIAVREILPDISDELATLIEDMLASNPENRPTTAGVALARLRLVPEFAIVPNLSPRTVSMMRPHRSLIRRRRRIWARAALAAIIIVGITAGFGWLWLHPSPDSALPKNAVPEVLAETTSKEPESPAPVLLPARSPDVDCIETLGDKVLFTAYAGEWRSLWCWDKATGESTPIWPALSLEPDDSVFKDGALPVAKGVVGVVRRASGGTDLFSTDGTRAGTVLLAHGAITTAAPLTLLGEYEDIVYFSRSTGDETYGLWQTDGTREGTRHLFGDAHDPQFTELKIGPVGDLYFSDLTSSALYCWPSNKENAYTLWTVEFPEAYNFGGSYLLENKLLLTGDYQGSGRELLAVTKEPGSIHLIRDFMPGVTSGIDVPYFTPWRNGVLLVASTPETGHELWFSDGTTEGTRLVRDMNPGVMSSDPYRFTESGGRVYFSALTTTEGRELWQTDGTEEGTRMVRDIVPGVGSAEPYALCPLRDGLLFTPRDAVLGEELWFTDGTEDGTRLLMDCMPGKESGEPHGTKPFGEGAVFGANHPEFQRVLWETDGTPEGTRPLFEKIEGHRAKPTEPVPWISALGRVFMVNTSPGLGAELWVTDIANGESALVRDIYPGPVGSDPHAFQVAGDYFYFAANDGIHGVELWRTDGTPEGTLIVLDAYTGIDSGNPRDLVQWGNNQLGFVANTGARGNAVFCNLRANEDFRVATRTDERGPDWNPTQLMDSGDGWLLFSVQNSAGQTTFWRTNGDTTLAIPAVGRGE